MPECARSVDVVLVNMPFGPLRHPSIGLSLLQSSLAELPAVRCKVLHFTLSFADRLGARAYHELALGYPHGPSLVGEWIFGPSRFEREPLPASEFLERFVRPEIETRHPQLDLTDDILRARKMAPGFIDWCAREVERLHPRIVGFTTVFQQNVASMALARRLKGSGREPFLLFGGANCEGVMGRELVRQFDEIDAVVSGEADAIFPALVRRVLDGGGLDDVSGVYTRANLAEHDGETPPNAPRIPSLDDLPLPDYDDFFEQWERSSVHRVFVPRLLFETSRGCWWGEKQHCTFCGLNGSTMAFRSKSADRALEELRTLTGRHPGVPVMVVDNILDMRYFQDFLPALARESIGVKLFYEVKANLRKDQIALLRDAGVTEIQPGVESLSDAVLALMRKGVSALQNIQLIKWCAELGVWPSWHFIWGFPGEPEEEYRRMAAMLPLLRHLPPPNVGMAIRLDRFSPNFLQGEELGLTGIEPTPAYRSIYPLEAQALHNLAYYFSFDYRDKRDVESYTSSLFEEITRWQEAYEESELFYLEKGEALWIWDLRGVAKRPFMILDGMERVLYLACDGVRTLESLARVATEASETAVGREDIARLLAPLVEGGLMLRDGDRFLSLALRRGEERERPLAPSTSARVGDARSPELAARP